MSKRPVWIALLVLLTFAGFVPGVRAQETGEGCTFTPASDIPLYLAPVLHPSQQKDTLPAGRPVTVRLQAPEYLYVTIDDAYGGYVDRALGQLNGMCEMNIPVDSAPLQTHPSLCLLHTDTRTLTPEVDLNTPTMTAETLAPNAYYVLTTQSPTAVFVYEGRDAGGWLTTAAIQGLEMVGNCSASASGHTATARENARLWSVPNVLTGEVLATLAPGEAVSILSQEVSGPVRAEVDLWGIWYLVSRESSGTQGWVWTERLNLDAPTARPSAVALENARVWNAPTVTTGQVLQTLPVNTVVELAAGPVFGLVRAEPYTEGAWYLVSQGGQTLGWVWSERLTITRG